MPVSMHATMQLQIRQKYRLLGDIVVSFFRKFSGGGVVTKQDGAKDVLSSSR